MASVTLSESAKLSQDMLVSGVIENIVTVNPFFERLPFAGIEGNALAYNRENALGDVQMLGVGGTITAKAAATFTAVTSSLTKIIGDAEVDLMIQATRSDKTDQKAAQIASKAKALGRKYQEQMIVGAGSSNDMTGLLTLVDSTKVVEANSAATNGGVLSFGDLDILIDLVTDKDGEVDYLAMHRRTIRAYYALCRATPGAGIVETITLPSGREVPTYRGIPIFANDWIPTNQTKGSASNATTVFAGTFDDGSMKHGIAGLTAKNAAGIQVTEIGEKETADESITRLKWYCGLALFNLNGLAALKNVIPSA